jgi:hypothetical protein
MALPCVEVPLAAARGVPASSRKNGDPQVAVLVAVRAGQLRSARASNVLSVEDLGRLLSIGAAVVDCEGLGVVVLGAVPGVDSLGVVVLGVVVLELGGVVGSVGVVFCARAMPPAVNKAATAAATLRVWVDLRMVDFSCGSCGKPRPVAGLGDPWAASDVPAARAGHAVCLAAAPTERPTQ